MRVQSASIRAEHRTRPAQTLWSRSTSWADTNPPIDWPAAMQGVPGSYLARTLRANCTLSSTWTRACMPLTRKGAEAVGGQRACGM